MGADDVPSLDITVAVSNFEQDAKKVLAVIRPAWAPEKIATHVYTDGITNKLMGFYLPSNPEGDRVMVRVNGEGTDLIIDRDEEQETFAVLSKVGCAPPVYCTFNNGMAYGYFSGEPLNIESVRYPNIQRLIAGEMAQLHHVTGKYAKQFDGGPILSQFREKAQSFLDTSPSKFEHAEKQASCLFSFFPRYKKLIPCKDDLQKELNELIDTLDALKMKSVFSHNDLLLKNIVFDESSNVLKFIDFEYAMYNYGAFDIGNHFAEYAGMENMDYTLYPKKPEQLVWLRHYLEATARLEGQGEATVGDKDVERLYVETNKCACAAHFFWGVWGLIQAEHSAIDFDYLDYSSQRLNEYFRRKKEFFPLQCPK